MSSEMIETLNGNDKQEMSGCPRFKQNAWKKELCSNCYRPKEEHKSKKKDRDPPAVITLKPAAHGILSLGSKNKRDKKKKKCVRFPKEESEVIGYGGLDASDSDDEDDFDFERNDQPAPVEREVAGEEEKALERLTKSNTDYNSSLKNLNGKGDAPKQQLLSSQPGKQQKQTIQVSIQPFSSSSTIAASRKSHLNKLLEDEDPEPTIINGSPKTNVKTSAKEMNNGEVKERKEKPKVKVEPKSPEDTMPNIKTIVIESKKEERGTPEGRKTHIQRGSIVTKAHEQAKNKLHVHNAPKSDKRPSDDQNEESEDVKTIIITSLSVEEKNEKNLQESIKDSIKDEVDSKVKITSKSEEVTVKVLKLLNGQNGPAESREMAGEPDGKADSDEHEQETPITPPPRSSFLHREMNPAPDPKLLPKPVTFSSTTDLKSKPAYQSEVKSPPRPTSLLNLNSDVKTSKPILNVVELNGSSPVLNTVTTLSNGSPALSESPTLNCSAPSLNGDSPVVDGSSPVLNGHHEPKSPADEVFTSKKQSVLNGSTPKIEKLEDPSPEPKKSFFSSLSGRKSSLESSSDTKKAFLLNGSCPDIQKSLNSSPEKPPKTPTGIEVKGSKSQQQSSPEGKSSKSIFKSDTKMSKAFNSLSSEFKSFKSFLSSPSESKLGKGALPPTPLTLARSASPTPALPAAPPPSSQSSSPSPSISTSSMSSKPPPSPCSSPPSSLDTSSSSIPPLPTTPPPQPTGAAPSLILTGQTAPVPPMTPLQINTSSPHPPMTPTDGVPVLQEVVRKRPAPKPPVLDVPPEPLPRRRNSSEANSGHGTEKKKTRVRQTLRKLWRFGSREEELPKPEDEPPAIPRPRPQIIHPLDLNKSAVQVLPAHAVADKPSPDSVSSVASVYSSRPSKPPPPPRSESLNLMERLRPRDSPPTSSSDNTYVNLGEGRCGITPVKPQRTGSMRDAQKAQQQQPVYQNELKASSTPKKVMAYGDSEHVYECVGVTSEVEKPSRHKAPSNPSSASPNCGSDEEIYYPYVTFQNGECKTVMKKRGVVTKSLEENYGAVVIANLEALAHLLRQINEKRPEVPSEIQTATNLDWSSFDFTDSQPVALNCFSFVDGSIGGVDVTLALSPSQMGLPTDLETWRRFSAVVPQPFVDGEDGDEKEISVLNRCKIERFVNFVKNLDKTVEGVREGVRLLLQILLYMTKEDMTSVDVSSFVVLSSAVPHIRHKACYLPPEEEESASCQDAAATLTRLLLGDLPLAKVLSKCTLSEMPAVLEVWLWGPTSVLPLQAIKRWLDLERANLLQSLVRATPSDELDTHHLSFLVHTTASQIVCANEIIHS